MTDCAAEIDEREIGLRARLDDALARVQTPDLGRIGGAPAYVIRDAHAAGIDLGQHQRHLRLDAGEPAVHGPDVVARLFRRRVGRVIGRDDVDRAVGKRRPQRRLVARLAHGRIDPDDAAEAGIVVGGQKKILRTGLPGDVDAARLRLPQGTQFLGRGNVQDVDARTGPLREDGGAAHCLDRDDRRTRREMRERVEATGIAHARLTPLHDGIGLSVQRHALAGASHRLESLEHRSGRWRGDLSKRVAHVELEADHSAFDERRYLLDGVLTQQAVEPEIDVRVRGGDAVLVRQRGSGTGRRNGVGHIEYGGHAAERCGRRAGLPIFLVRIARIAKMHVHVDGAGQDMKSACVKRLARSRHHRIRPDRDNVTVVDGNAGIDDGLGRHDPAAAYDEISRAHRRPHNIAQPPSTGRSIPVIWREASLARNRQALATSTSLDTRLSA